MSKKCFITLLCFVVFVAIMTSLAYVFASLELELWLRGVIGGAALLTFTTLAALLHENIPAGIVLFAGNAAAFAMLTSMLFVTCGTPAPAIAAAACGIAAGAMLFYCLLTNITAVQNGFALFMILYAAAAIAGALIYALSVRTAEGWFALILLAPFLLFFIGLVLEAETPADQLANTLLVPGMAIIYLVVLVLHLHNPYGDFDPISIDTQSGNPYSFD